MTRTVRAPRGTQLNCKNWLIEAPYRNSQVVEVALSTLSPDTLLHISVDLHTDSEWSLTKTIREWKKVKLPDLHKRPAVFVVKG